MLYDNQATELNIIDLDQLKLQEKVKFEKEGPNGTGAFVTWMSYLDAERLLMANYDEMAIFDLKGNKLKGHSLTKGEFEGDRLSEGVSFQQWSIVAENGDAVYGLMSNWQNENEFFYKVDFKNNLIKRIELPGREMLPDYMVAFKSDDMYAILPALKTVRRINNHLIISHSGYANLFVVDMATDSAYQVDYTPKLTAKAKKGGYPAEVDSEKRFREVMEQIFAEINFQAPIWDAKNKRYYRFSFETTPTGNTDGPLFQSAESRKISKVFLSIFDDKLNLIGETSTDLKHAPAHAFVKEGQIWSYVNVGDELGFVRLKMD